MAFICFAFDYAHPASCIAFVHITAHSQKRQISWVHGEISVTHILSVP